MARITKVKVTIILIILIFITVGIFSTVSLSIDNSEQVSLQVTPSPLIDVVLTKSKTSTNVTNFDTDLLNALRNQGVDITKVNIESVESEYISSNDADASVIFNTWEKYPKISGSIFEANWSLSGNEIRTNANVHWTGFWNKEAVDASDYTIEFDVMNGNADPLGFTFRMNEIGSNEYSFYGVELDCMHKTLTLGKITSWIPNANDDEHGGPIYHTKISASDGNYDNYATSSYSGILNHCEGSRLQYKSYPFENGQWYNVKIEVYGSNIKVYIDDSLIINYTDSSSPLLSGGYGPYTDSNPDGHFRNVTISTQYVRKLTEVLREPEWRDNSIRVLVNISDVQNEELNNTSQLGELVTRLINENINFAAWGKSANQSQFQNLINSNNGNGIFINNSSYSNSIQSTAVYIKSLIDQIDTNNQYILLDSQTVLTSDPEDVFNNTADENYPYGKWRIVHDYLYYENNIGQFSQSRRYIDDMITKFDKTGKYTITYADNPVNPSEVYVHRRPVALLKSTKSGTNLSLISSSYDLDSYSQGNNGVAEEEWRYKRTTDNTWTVGKPTSISSNTDYVVQLRVKDYQGTWSYPVSVYATNRSDALPIASFGIVNNEITRYETLEVVDTSYDPYGGSITSRVWEVYKGSTRIYSGTQPLTTYTDLGEYTMTLTVRNNRNLTSETYSRKFKIIEDSIAPEVVASPESSDWTQSVNVSLNFSDLGGSNFRSYQYAITDSQATPTSWSSAITNASDIITINQEGVKYLHIRAQDNAGNMSDDRVLGEYKIDNSGPNIEVTGDMETIVIDKLDLNINVTDTLSGLKNIKINGQEVQNGTNTFMKNGEYTIVAEDNVGNTSTKVINIENIYYECNAGLEHPIYSSTYDECPICDAFEGLKVTVQSHIYNAQNQGVEYENPKNATITEYYNDVKENHKDVGTYNYELKVVYEGNEYKTGLTGKYTIDIRTLTIDGIVATNRTYDKSNFEIEVEGGVLHNLVEGNPDNIGFELNGAYVETNTAGEQTVKIREVELTNNNPVNYKLVQPSDIKVEILQKELNIVDIHADDKIYDGNDIIRLSGGNLVGVYEGDEVTFVLPETGKSESKNVGIHKITIEEITIEGEDAFNYILKQPELGEVQANITKREVYVEKLKGKTRAYDGTNIVEVIEGNLVNKVNGDSLTAVVPPTGISESAEVGRWNVSIDDIVLIGDDKDNYVINQPQEGEIKVIIMRDEGILEIGCDSKKFDRLPIEPYVISNNSTAEVSYKFYKVGTNEEIEKPYEIGDYEVVASMDTDGNYTPDQTDRVPFSITKPDEPIIKVDGKINEINGEKTETSAEEPVGLRYKDSFKIRIDISNIGIGSGYASEVAVNLPEGIEISENSEMNNQYGWKLTENILTTDIYSIENDIDNEIYPNDEGRYLEVELIVTKQDKEKMELPIEVSVKQQDKHGDIIEYSEENSVNSKIVINTEYKFFDASVKNRIYGLILTDATTKKQETFDVYQHDGEIIKAELSDKRVASSIATINYQIVLKNEGNDDGIVTNITNILPKGITFNTNENKGWKIDNTGRISYGEEIELKPGETKKIQLLLNWDLRTQSLGTRENQVAVSSANDIDEILVNEEKMNITESNNYSSSEILISLPTGSNVIQYIMIVFVDLLILSIGITLIKKYVLKKEK